MKITSTISLGKKQKAVPIPSSVSDLFDLLIKLSGALIPIVIAAPFIPTGVSDIISYCLGGLITVLPIIKPYFGVREVPPFVPADEVEVIKDAP